MTFDAYVPMIATVEWPTSKRSITMINPVTNEPFTEADADRMLGLADQFLEDWEQNEGKHDAECGEARMEWDAIRPLLVQAPALLTLLIDARAALLDGYDGDLQGILTGDICAKAIERAKGALVHDR